MAPRNHHRLRSSSSAPESRGDVGAGMHALAAPNAAHQRQRQQHHHQSSSSSGGGGGSSSAGPQEETKEPDPSREEPALAPIEPWTYSESISVSFCRAQSMLHEIYGGCVQATGYKTLGHSCVTDEDRAAAKGARSSLLYGELLPRGVNRSLGALALNAADADVLFDLGMGTGKVAVQAFLQFPTLSRVYGVEISLGRYRVAERAALNLAGFWPNLFEVERHVPDSTITVRAIDPLRGNGGISRTPRKINERRLELAVGDMLQTSDVETADIVMLETEIPVSIFGGFVDLLERTKEGARLFTYLDLELVWQRMKSLKASSVPCFLGAT